MNKQFNYDVVIIGGGAAGLMMQYQLSNTKLNVLLIDKNSELGKKLSITGNTRCNVTNNLTPKEFIAQIRGTQEKFFYKALHKFSPQDVVAFFESRGVPLKLENDFQYFPVSDKAKDIIDVLKKSIDQFDVHYEEEATSITKSNKHYLIKTNKHQYKTKFVVVATGSSSFPKTGSSGDGLKFASSLGIITTPFYPAETKVYASTIESLSLQGLSISNATVRILHTKHKVQGDVLFTHNGLSGPAIYHLSEDIYHTLQEKKVICSIDLLNISEEYFNKLVQEEPNKTLETVIAKLTSKRLASTLFNFYELPKKPIKELHQSSINKVYQLCSAFSVNIDAVEDKAKAYVNGGGILTKELNPDSMEAKKAKHCYFIGEAIDLHGPIGGFNITIAFSTAYSAAQNIKEEINARTT